MNTEVDHSFNFETLGTEYNEIYEESIESLDSRENPIENSTLIESKNESENYKEGAQYNKQNLNAEFSNRTKTFNEESNHVRPYPEKDQEIENEGFTQISVPLHPKIYPSPLNINETSNSTAPTKQKIHKSKKKRHLNRRKHSNEENDSLDKNDDKYLKDRMYHTYYRGYLKEFLKEEMDQLVEARVRLTLMKYLKTLQKIQNEDKRDKSELSSGRKNSEPKSENHLQNSDKSISNSKVELENKDNLTEKLSLEKTKKNITIPQTNLNTKELNELSDESVEIEVENPKQSNEYQRIPLDQLNDRFEETSQKIISKSSEIRPNVSVEEIQEILDSKKPIVPTSASKPKEIRSEINSIIEKLADFQERHNLEARVESISSIDTDTASFHEVGGFDNIKTPISSNLNSARSKSKNDIEKKSNLNKFQKDSTDNDSDQYFEPVSVEIKPLEFDKLEKSNQKDNINNEIEKEKEPFILNPQTDYTSISNSSRESKDIEDQFNLEPSKDEELIDNLENLSTPSPIVGVNTSIFKDNEPQYANEEKSSNIDELPIESNTISQLDPANEESNYEEKLKNHIKNLNHVSSTYENILSDQNQLPETNEIINIDERIKILIEETGSTLSKEDLFVLAKVSVSNLVKMYEEIAKGLSKKEALENLANRAREDLSRNKELLSKNDTDKNLAEQSENQSDENSKFKEEALAFCNGKLRQLKYEKKELRNLREKYNQEKSLYVDSHSEQDSTILFKIQVCSTLIRTQLYHWKRSYDLISNLKNDPTPVKFHDTLDKWASLEEEKYHVKSRIDQQDKEYSEFNKRIKDGELSRFSFSPFSSPDRSGNISSRSSIRKTRSPRLGGTHRKGIFEEDIEGVFEPIDESDPLFLSFEKSRIEQQNTNNSIIQNSIENEVTNISV